MREPLTRGCTHVESHGLNCGAGKGDPCCELDANGNWISLAGFHPERIDQGHRTPLHNLGQFTPTQRRVIALIANGHNRESVSHQLGISVFTTARHLSNVYEKLGVNSMLEVAVWYYRSYWQPRSVA